MEMAEQVGKLYMKGYSPADISVELDVRRVDVSRALRDWRDLLRRETITSLDVKDKVMDILAETEESLRLARKQAWETAEQADANGQYGTKVQALKLYRDLSKDINEIFDKAGINQDVEVIEEMTRQQEAQDQLIELLKEIKKDYPQVNDLISRRLNRIMGATEEVEAHEIEAGKDMEPSE